MEGSRKPLGSRAKPKRERILESRENNAAGLYRVDFWPRNTSFSWRHDVCVSVCMKASLETWGEPKAARFAGQTDEIETILESIENNAAAAGHYLYLHTCISRRLLALAH